MHQSSGFCRSHEQCYPYLPNPFAREGYDTRSLFKRSLTIFRVFPSPRLVASPSAEEPSLLCYLPIAGGRILGFIPFPRVLVLCEMQSVSFRIWTRVPCPFPTMITVTPRAPANDKYYRVLKLHSSTRIKSSAI